MEDSRKRLAATIAEVRKRIDRAGNRSTNLGEQNTKATLIEPILDALGWRLDSIDDVYREYRSKPQDNPVDYALFIHRTPRLFIEAKSLEKNPSDRKWIGQTLSYATIVGVEWCVLTNGDEYRLYNAHAPVDVEDKLFRAVRISDSNEEQLVLETLELLSKDKTGDNLISALWKSHFVDQHVQAALRKLLSGDDPGMVRHIRRHAPELKPGEIRDSLKRAEIRVDHPVIGTDAEAPSAPAKPKAKSQRPVPAKPRKDSRPSVGLDDIVRAGLVNPPLQLTRKYKGTVLTASVRQDGMVVFDGEAFETPSAAGGVARKSIVGAPPGKPYPATNGWNFWRYLDPETGTEQKLDELRQKYAALRASETKGRVFEFKKPG